MGEIHFDITVDSGHIANEFNKVREAIRKTVEYAEKGGRDIDKAFEKIKALESLKAQIDLSNPKAELEKFDQQVQLLCKNLDQYFDTLQGRLKDMASVVGSGQAVVGNVPVSDDNAQQIADLQKQNAELMELIKKRQAELENEREAYNQLADAVRNNDIPAMREYSGLLQQSEGHHVRIRTEIMNARDDMAKLIEAGQRGTPEFQQIAEQTGKMRREMALANATMQYFADPNKDLHTLKTGLQGVAGAAGLVTGVLGIFNTESEKMAQIQAKVSSIMAIIVGLETTYNLVKKSSNVMLAIEEVKTWAVAKARGVQTAATVAATAAQEGLNTAMRSNPIGAILSLLAILGTAIYAVAKALFTESDAEKKAREEKEAHIKAIKEQQEQWVKSVADSSSKMMVSLKELQRKWNELGDDMKAKERFVKDNQAAFHSLGFAVGSVTDAESILVKNTDAVVNAIMARAKASAYEKLMQDQYEKEVQARLEANKSSKSVANGGSIAVVKAGDKSNKQSRAYDNAKKAGYTFQKGDVDSENRWTEQGRKRIEYYSRLYAAQQKEAFDKREKVRRDTAQKDIQATENFIEKEINAEKAAAEKAGIKLYNGEKDHSKEDAANARREEDEAKRRAEAQQKMAELLDKQKRDQSRKAVDLQFSTREAEIKAMSDGTDKTIRQIELDRDREMAAIERSYEDLKIARIEEAKKLYEADPKNKGTNFYESGLFINTDWDATYTKEEKANRIAREKAVNIEADKRMKEQLERERQYLNDYIKEYGSIQQQKEAIAREYADKIEKAETEAQKDILRKQEEELQKALDFKQLQQDMDWERVFGDLDRYSTAALRELKENLRKALDAKDITVENAKVLAEKINEVDDKIISRSDAWAAFLPILRERKRLIEESVTAEQTYQNLLAKQKETQSKMAGLKANAAGVLMMAGKDATDLSIENLKRLMSEMNPASEAFKHLNDIVDKLNLSEIDLAKATDEAAKAQRAKASIDNQVKNFSTVKEAYKNGIDAAGGEIQYGLQQLQELPELIDAIGLHDTEFGQGVDEFVSGTSNFASAIQKFQSGDFVGAATDAIKGIQDYGHLVERIGGFSFSGSNADEVRAENNRLIAANENLTKSIDSLRGVIDEKYGKEAAEAAEKARQQQQEKNENILARFANEMGYHSAHRSNSYYYDIGQNNADKLNEFLKVNGIDKSVRAGVWEDLMNLTPEEMKLVSEQLGDVWSVIISQGKYDRPYEILDEYIDQAGKVAEIDEQLIQRMMGASTDSVFESFLDDLYDLANGSEDVFDNMADNWQKMVNKMVIDNLVGAQFQGKIKEWAEKVAKLTKEMSNGGMSPGEYAAELDLLEKEKEGYMKEAQNLIDTYRNSGAIKDTGNVGTSDKSASALGLDKISYEQADQIEGQLTAIQIAQGQNGATAKLILTNIQTLNNVVAGTGSSLVNLAVTRNEYLLDIKKSNREMIETFTNDMDRMYRLIDDRLS